MKMRERRLRMRTPTHLHPVVALLGDVEVGPVDRHAVGVLQLAVALAARPELAEVHARVLIEHLQRATTNRKGISHLIQRP